MSPTVVTVINLGLLTLTVIAYFFQAYYAKQQVTLARDAAAEAGREAATAITHAAAAQEHASHAEAQARAAEEQAEHSRRQAEAAQRQAATAEALLAEARRANDLTAKFHTEHHARNAVVWKAEIDAYRYKIRNVGFESAFRVQAQPNGADEDWQHRWSMADPDDYEAEEVRPQDYFPYRFSGRAPEQIYVSWEGAPNPVAVPLPRPNFGAPQPRDA